MSPGLNPHNRCLHSLFAWGTLIWSAGSKAFACGALWVSKIGQSKQEKDKGQEFQNPCEKPPPEIHFADSDQVSWRDKALSLWSGITDSKALDYQRTNPRSYQWELRPKKPLEYKTRHHTATSSTLCRMPHLSNKSNKNTNPTISRQDYHLTQPCPSQEKQRNKQKLSTLLTL